MKSEKVKQGSGGTSSERRRSEGTPTPAAACPDRLQKFIEEFCGELLTTFAPRVEGNAKGFKRRVLALIAKRLPPFRKSPGRPRLRYVTLAANAYQLQMEEKRDGRREKIDWLRIAMECNTAFGAIRSIYKRQIVLKRLRDTVHARLNMARKNVRLTNPTTTE